LITTCRFEDGRENKTAGVRSAVLSVCGLFVAAIFAAVFEALLRLFKGNSHFFQALPYGHVQIDFREIAFAVACIFFFHSVDLRLIYKFSDLCYNVVALGMYRYISIK